MRINTRPDNRGDGIRHYTLLAKPSLDAAKWLEVDPDNIPTEMRFFKVEVDVK